MRLNHKNYLISILTLIYIVTMRLNIVLCVIAITFVASETRKCEECVAISECPSIMKYLDPQVPENKMIIRRAYCGISEKIVKVCCSDFSSDEDDIESHPNARLLPKNCGAINGNRIIGGSVASLYEFPWMALISYRIGDDIAFQCAGSIINTRYILTAAHCIVGREIIGVRIGEFDIRYDLDCQKSPTGGPICESHYQDIRVETAIPHRKYKGHPKYAFDIGLIRLQLPINFEYRNAGPICLPMTKELRTASLGNKIATIAGWGLTENQRESSVLLKVEIPIHPDETCVDFFSRILDPSDSSTGPSQFCAGSPNKDSCNGDSGGPLIIEEKYKQVSRFIQYGIVSQGVQTCGSQIPAVYTAVSKHLKWILDTIKP